MAERIHLFSRQVQDAEGRRYVASAHGQRDRFGTWEGWLEFSGLGRGVVLATGIETRQPDRRALGYWASGLQPTYLQGALARAVRARLEAFRLTAR